MSYQFLQRLRLLDTQRTIMNKLTHLQEGQDMLHRENADRRWTQRVLVGFIILQIAVYVYFRYQ